MKRTEHMELLRQFVFRFHPPAVPTRGDPVELEVICDRLPGRFPRLYERLLLSYCWDEVEFPVLTLLSNPGIPRLLGSLLYDKHVCNVLVPKGYIPFGREGGRYDPICFELSERKGKRDCRVVQLDHEEALCNSRVSVRNVLAPSFVQLVKNLVGGV